MKIYSIKKSLLSVIPLIPLILFLTTNSYAGDNKATNQTPTITSVAKSFMLAKSQYYVPPPKQKDNNNRSC